MVLLGTAKHNTLRNSWFSHLRVGPLFYGRTETLYCENCTINNLDFGNGQLESVSNFTFSNGTLKLPVSGPVRWATPGNKILFADHTVFLLGNPFVITNIRADVNFTYLDTTLSSIPVGSIAFLPHPCAHTTFVNCSGDPNVVSMSSQNSPRPLWSYGKRLYTGNVGKAGVFTDKPVGYFSQVTFNVIRAYTGAKPTLFLHISAGYIDSGFVGQVWTLDLDLKTAGIRACVPGTSPNLGVDSIPVVPAGSWMYNGIMNLKYSQDISADTFAQWPIVAIEAITDQGLVLYDFIEGVSTTS
jgi:hypothetical protein